MKKAMSYSVCVYKKALFYVYKSYVQRCFTRMSQALGGLSLRYITIFEGERLKIKLVCIQKFEHACINCYVELNTYKMCSIFNEMSAAKFKYICDYIM